MRTSSFKKITALLLASVIAVFVVSCEKTGNNNESEAGEVAMNFPDNWTTSEDLDEYVVLQGISPLEDNEDTFRENINIAVEKASGYNLESYTDANIEAIKGAFSQFNLESSSDTTINGMPAKKIIFTATLQGYNLKYLDFLFHKNDFGYVITCTALEDSYDQYRDQFNEIVSTFSID